MARPRKSALASLRAAVAGRLPADTLRGNGTEGLMNNVEAEDRAGLRFVRQGESEAHRLTPVGCQLVCLVCEASEQVSDGGQ
jgi:hypothetical protein